MNILYLGDINSIHDFKWITYFSNKNAFNVFITSEEENFATLTDEWALKVKNANVVILPPISNFSLSNPFKSYSTVKKLRRYIKDYEIDVFHALFGSPQAIWVNFLPNNIKKFITTRGSDVLVLYKGLTESTALKDVILRNLLLRGFKKTDSIASTSEQQISFLKKVGINKSALHLIKTGVNVNEIAAHGIDDCVRTSKQKFIFSARYIGEVYNMDYQLLAIKSIPKEILKDYSFLFVKRVEDKSDFTKNFLLELNKIPDLTYDLAEGLTQSEMWATIKSSSLTYMVPKSDGTPNTALECMAARVPLIMGNLNYNKELFDNVCLRVDLSNPLDFVDKLTYGLKQYPNDLLNKAENIVKEFGSRDAEMNKLEKLYLQGNVK